MKSNAMNTLYVDFSHISHFFVDIHLDDILIDGFNRYEPYIRKAVHNFMFKLYPETKETDIFFISFYRAKSTIKYVYL